MALILFFRKSQVLYTVQCLLSPSCFQLNWPPRSDSCFLMKPRNGKGQQKAALWSITLSYTCKRSFHHLWIFLILMFQVRDETPELARGVSKAVYDLYDVITHDLLTSNLREQFDTWQILARARNDGCLFARIEWPRNPEIKEQVKRLHLLLTVKDSAANVPKNLEARRRLQFFTNSLFMEMPSAKPISEMTPFSVFTPMNYTSKMKMESLSYSTCRQFFLWWGD